MTDTLSPATASDISPERRIVTEIPGPNSKALHDRRVKVVSQGVSEAFPIYIDRAHDAIIVDVDGNQFIDFTGGIGVTTVGHTNNAVVEAVRDQVGKVTHTLFGLVGYESYIRAAELLAQHTPGDFEKKSVFVNSGAEAVENAVKIARKFTGRTEVAVLYHGYHGRTNLTASMNYNMHPYGTGFGPLAGSVHHAPNSSPFHDGLSGEEAAKRTITHLEKRVGASQIACLVVEPIQGEGGFIVPAEGYLPALVEWCHNNGIVYVSDEVQSGMVRTGAYFASEHFGIVPDLTTSAKGIGGGLPIAAVTGRADIMDASHPGGLGGTFGGNPVSAAAVVAAFDDVERRGLIAEAKRVEATLKSALVALQAKHSLIADVRGMGAMLAIELVDASGAPAADAVKAVQAYALHQGVLFLNAGTFGNVLRFLPSVVMSDELLLDAVSVLDDALSSLG
jgi:4-aminobutyrate aminotransferase/(S)-3-amino-2-methylpropionate transaminase